MRAAPTATAQHEGLAKSAPFLHTDTNERVCLR